MFTNYYVAWTGSILDNTLVYHRMAEMELSSLFHTKHRWRETFRVLDVCYNHQKSEIEPFSLHGIGGISRVRL